jgi:hypothetical protein
MLYFGMTELTSMLYQGVRNELSTKKENGYDE